MATWGEFAESSPEPASFGASRFADRSSHDLVFFDQRGTGRSEAALYERHLALVTFREADGAVQPDETVTSGSQFVSNTFTL